MMTNNHSNIPKTIQPPIHNKLEHSETIKQKDNRTKCMKEHHKNSL